MPIVKSLSLTRDERLTRENALASQYQDLDSQLRKANCVMWLIGWLPDSGGYTRDRMPLAIHANRGSV